MLWFIYFTSACQVQLAKNHSNTLAYIFGNSKDNGVWNEQIRSENLPKYKKFKPSSIIDFGSWNWRYSLPSKMEFSNFNCPSSDEMIRLNKHENSATDAAVATKEWEPGSLAASIPTGLSDYAKMNTNYANLLRDFGVDGMNNGQIVAELESVLGIKITGRTEEPAQWALVQPDEESRQRVHSQLVLLRLYKRWAMSSIAAKLSMQVYEVRSIVKEYKRKLKAVIRSRADEARQKRRMLGADYLQTLESALDQRKGTRITVSKLKRDLTRSHPELDGISDFWVRDALRNRWACSFKKLERAPRLSVEGGRVRMFHKSAYVVLRLLEEEVEAIFFDKF